MPDPQNPIDLPCACSALRKATRAVSRYYEARLAPAGVTTTQYSILRLLQREGPTPLLRIAEAMVMERTSAYRAVAPLVRDGLVELCVSDEDARVKLALLTRRGEEKIRAVVPHWRDAQGTFVSAVGAAEWQEFATGLDRLVTLMVEAAARGEPPPQREDDDGGSRGAGDGEEG